MTTKTVTTAMNGGVGVWMPVTPRAVASSLCSGMSRMGATSLRTTGELCPQAPTAHAVVRVRTELTAVATAAGTGGADWIAAIDVPQIAAGDRRFGTEQYGKPPHETGTRVCRSSA